ncbi:hypothetical protein LUZ61_015905 [Rhynchospora tenuis]|uniref:DUF547 domain-containing protein n=1 Tax=Rhynchospora tenuis TaxID=198213 RepID=A0AAD5Z4I6_9POAL|nr:hypothetical protein LUZ61_015905 [Rhynchospora tenuis]
MYIHHLKKTYILHYTAMKFKYFLMNREEKHQRKLELELEVAELQNTLENEQKVNQILQCSLQGRLVCPSCLSSLVPLQVQVILAELAMVEEEIIYLERKLEDMKLCLHRERKQNKEWSLLWWHRRQKQHFLCGLGGKKQIKMDQDMPPVPSLEWGERFYDHGRKASFDMVSEKSISCADQLVFDVSGLEENRPRSRSKSSCSKSSCSFNFLEQETNTEPSKISEEIIKLLINIFHKLNKRTEHFGYDLNSSPKLSISCISSKSFEFKPSPSSTPLSNADDAMRNDKGLAGFINFTSDCFDITRIALYIPEVRRLRELIQRLSFVDLSLMTYKQKLAFWINIYNSCIMQAFLNHGVPPSPDKLLGLLNKAAVNIGGIVLNALAIEHFILRQSSFDTNPGTLDKRKGFLRDVYGLEYPEPNVTFALCRGSRSSPALRVYTAENVTHELEMAKIEYLASSIKVAGRRKIVIPKLLYWHMRDFADDMESLLEWVHSQLPKHGSLKQVIKELLSTDLKTPILKAIEIEPYDAEFCYLLPV